MLKDLDDRDREQKTPQTHAAQRDSSTTSKKTIILITAVIVIINVTGLFIWQLYSENQALKIASENNHISTKIAAKGIKQKADDEIAHDGVTRNNQFYAPVIAEVPAVNNKKATSESVYSSKLEQSIEQEVLPQEKSMTHTYLPQVKATSAVQPKQQTVTVKKVISTPKVKRQNDSSSMSVSRRQLTTKELLKKKVNLAEKALNNNELPKAEKLYEDILFIEPSHKFARTKLAALWFGRQAYQPAVNLLSQGIALDPSDADFRLMKARIFLNQNQPEAALAVLKSFTGKADAEYQSLMANIAQQNGDFKTAINTYEQLLKSEPQSARWWLGLAIAYDSDMSYKKAVDTYQAALALGNLSTPSAEFAEQRMQELGE